jgi:hypothetical protein
MQASVSAAAPHPDPLPIEGNGEREEIAPATSGKFQKAGAPGVSPGWEREGWPSLAP